MDPSGIAKELKSYIDLFFTSGNPVFLSIFFTISIISTIYFFYRIVLTPLKEKFLIEKERLNKENRESIILFAELDPDPIVQVNSNGIILHTNNAAKALSKKENLIKRNILDIIPNLKIDFEDFIEKNKSFSGHREIEGRHYSILSQGICKYKILQIYFHDVTSIKQYENRLKEYSKNLQDNIETERQRISYELHDGVGQNLSIVKLIINKLSKEAATESSKAEFCSATELLESSIKELKRISFNLKPRILEEMGLEAALISLCDLITRESALKGEAEIHPLKKRLDNGIELDLYRISQEILNNIIKHAKASKFQMRLLQVNNIIRLVIADDGAGILDPDKESSTSFNKKGLGLISIKQRVKNRGGTINIDSVLGQGTLIKIEIPVIED